MSPGIFAVIVVAIGLVVLVMFGKVWLEQRELGQRLDRLRRGASI